MDMPPQNHFVPARINNRYNNSLRSRAPDLLREVGRVVVLVLDDNPELLRGLVGPVVLEQGAELSVLRHDSQGVHVLLLPGTFFIV